MKKKLSIIVPCFNEAGHIEELFTRINDVKLDYEKEIITVDDGSTDNTNRNIQAFVQKHPLFPIKVIRHEKNKGKGSCLQSAMNFVTGDLVIVQDADLEYDPNDYPKLIKLIDEDLADVVFGSRFKGGDPHRGPFFFHRIGNNFFTSLVNLLTGKKFTDIHTCYKMYKTEILKSIHFREKRFGVDPELVVKLSKRKDVRIQEVEISYQGRNYAEGKKISWPDAFRALYCILKYHFFD